MAGGQERALRRRIKSVQSTKKITKAMELISASRIAKAQERVAAARPYSERITDVIRNLAAAGAGGDRPLLNPRERGHHRGLRGGGRRPRPRRRLQLRRSSAAPSARMAADKAAGRQTALITVGKKAQGYFRFRGYEIAESFAGFTRRPDLRGRPRGRRPTWPSAFESGEYSEVHLAYTQFLSMGSAGAAGRAVHAARHRGADRGRRRAPARRPTTSSSPARPRSSSACCPATPRPGSTPPCSTPPPPSTPPASGP